MACSGCGAKRKAHLAALAAAKALEKLGVTTSEAPVPFVIVQHNGRDVRLIGPDGDDRHDQALTGKRRHLNLVFDATDDGERSK